MSTDKSFEPFNHGISFEKVFILTFFYLQEENKLQFVFWLFSKESS